jgi:hypothetical protein
MNSTRRTAGAVAVGVMAPLSTLFAAGPATAQMANGGMMGGAYTMESGWMWVAALLIVVLGGGLVAVLLKRK